LSLGGSSSYTSTDIRINTSKRNDTNTKYKKYKITVNISTHITKTPAHAHPHITKQVKATTVHVNKNTVQDIPQ
jgi:hypothetical protein